MLRSLFLILLTSCLIFNTQGQTGAEKARSTFHKDMFSEEQLETFVEHYKSNTSPIAYGYSGIAETMLAEHAFLPTSKLGYFNRGIERIDGAIKRSTNNPELRYIRLLVQLNAPSFLGYDEDIENDLNIFIQKLSSTTLSKTWKLKFIEGLLSAEYISEGHKNRLKKLKLTIT